MNTTSYFLSKSQLSSRTSYHAVYGEDCDFVVKLHEVYKVLLLPQVINQEHSKFTEELCKQVVWAIHEDKCEFFSVRLHPDDFGFGKTPKKWVA